MTSAVSPEKQLLVYCAHTQLDSSLAQKIAQLLECDLDFDYVLDQAEENSISPLVGRQLQAVGSPILGRGVSAHQPEGFQFVDECRGID